MDQEIKEFTQAIGATRPQPHEENYKLFKAVFRRANYFRHKNGAMIIKISRSERPFWGVGKKYIDFLNELGVNYFLVLLESERSGYVFTKKELNRNIERKEWRLGSDDNYKINPPLPNRNVFRNAEQFLHHIGAKVA